jgi:hypothetical protein
MRGAILHSPYVFKGFSKHRDDFNVYSYLSAFLPNI